MSEKLVIDGENAVLGRLSSYAAKQALQGKDVVILNSEKAIVLGREKNILENYRKKRARKGDIQKGPFFPTLPERILKRTIRGMLPYTRERGRTAFKRIKCYIGMPEQFKNEKIVKSARGKQGMSLGKISEMLRGI